MRPADLRLLVLVASAGCFSSPATAPSAETPGAASDLSVCARLAAREQSCAQALAQAPTTREPGTVGVDLSNNPYSFVQGCSRFIEPRQAASSCLDEPDCAGFASCHRSFVESDYTPLETEAPCPATLQRTLLECPIETWHELPRAEPERSATVARVLAAEADCDGAPALARALSTCLILPCPAYSGCVLDVVENY